jgi:hypothetical protein
VFWRRSTRRTGSDAGTRRAERHSGYQRKRERAGKGGGRGARAARSGAKRWRERVGEAVGDERKCGALHRELAAVEGQHGRAGGMSEHFPSRQWGRWGWEGGNGRRGRGARARWERCWGGVDTHGDALDVVAKDLAVALRAALAEALTALAASGHFLSEEGEKKRSCGSLCSVKKGEAKRTNFGFGPPPAGNLHSTPCRLSALDPHHTDHTGRSSCLCIHLSHFQALRFFYRSTRSVPLKSTHRTGPGLSSSRPPSPGPRAQPRPSRAPPPTPISSQRPPSTARAGWRARRGPGPRCGRGCGWVW